MSRPRKARTPALPSIAWRRGGDEQVAELAGLRCTLATAGLQLTATIERNGAELVREQKQCRDADHADFMARRAIDRLELEMHRAFAKQKREARK